MAPQPDHPLVITALPGEGYRVACLDRACKIGHVLDDWPALPVAKVIRLNDHHNGRPT